MSMCVYICTCIYTYAYIYAYEYVCVFISNRDLGLIKDTPPPNFHSPQVALLN